MPARAIIALLATAWLLTLLPMPWPAASLRAQESVPPHLAAFAAQLVAANRDHLRASQGADDSASLRKQAHATLKRATLHLWSKAPARLDSIISRYARALGLKKPPDGKATAALLRFHRTWRGEKDTASLRALLNTLDLDPPEGKKLTSLARALGDIRAGEKSNLPSRHTIRTKDNRRIDLVWDRKTDDFTITVSEPGGANREPFEVSLKGKVHMKPADNGTGVQASATPDPAAPVETLNARGLKERGRKLAGEWFDQKGRKWRIETQDGINLAISYSGGAGKWRSFGTVRLNARYLSARRLYKSTDELKRSLPDGIKQQLVNNPAAYERLELAYYPAKKDGEDRWEGKLWNLKVTYDPSSLTIDSIHSPYARPLVLKRKKKQKRYRIGKLTINGMPLKIRLQNIDMRISRIRTKIAALDTTIKRFANEYDAARKRLATQRANEKAARQAIARLRREIDRLTTPPGFTPLERQALAELQHRITNALLRQEAGVLSASEAFVLRQDRKRLKKLEQRRAAARPPQYRSQQAYEQRIRQLNALIRAEETRIVDARYWHQRAEQDRASASIYGKAALEEQEALRATLRQLERLQRRLQQRVGPERNPERTFISQIVIWKEDDESIYTANARDLDYEEGLRSLETRITRAREVLRVARLLRASAINRFTEETRKTQELGEQLAETILQAARNKQAVEIAGIAAGVIKDFVKGGPVAAAGGAAYKLLVETPVMNLAGGRGAFERKQVRSFDETSIRQQMEAQFRKLAKSSMLDGKAAGIAGKRLAKATLSTALKDRVKSTLLRNSYGRWAQRMAIKGRSEDLAKFLKGDSYKAWLKHAMIKRRAAFLKKLMKDLDKLNKPNPATGLSVLAGGARNMFRPSRLKRMVREFDWKQSVRTVLKKAANPDVIRKIGKSAGEGLIIDTTKAMLLKYFESAEKQAWIDYLQQEMLARMVFTFWRSANRHYFEALDHLNSLLKARERFLQEVDRDSNYHIRRNLPFPADARLYIGIYHFYRMSNGGLGAKEMSGDGVETTIDGRRLRMGTYRGKPTLMFDAASIDREDGARLPLTITLQ